MVGQKQVRQQNVHSAHTKSTSDIHLLYIKSNVHVALSDLQQFVVFLCFPPFLFLPLAFLGLFYLTTVCVYEKGGPEVVVVD